MSTIKDLHDLSRTFEQAVALFGATNGARKEFLEKCSGVGQSIMKELKLTQGDARKLPLDTVLPPQADALYQELSKWLDD